MFKVFKNLSKSSNYSQKYFQSTEVIHQQGTILCKLAYQGDLAKIKYYIEEQKFDVNSYDADWRTPLHLAVAEGKLDIVKYLISKGALLIQDLFGNIAIHDAKFTLNQEMVQMLNKLPVKSDYKFAQKHKLKEQIIYVSDAILKSGIFNLQLITSQLNYFYNDLHLNSIYYQVLDKSMIKSHILALMIASQAENLSSQRKGLFFFQESFENPYYLSSSENVSLVYEKMNENLKHISAQKAIQIQIHTSEGAYRANQKQPLQIFQIITDNYINSSQDIEKYCQKQFLMTPKTIQQEYQKLLDKTIIEGPQFHSFKHNNETIIFLSDFFKNEQPKNGDSIVSHSQNIQALDQVFSEIALQPYYRVMDTFSNGVKIYAFYLKKSLTDQQLIELQQKTNIVQINGIFLRNYLIDKKCNVLQFQYLLSVYNFIKNFLEIRNEDFDYLKNLFQNEIIQLQKLNTMNSVKNLNIKDKIVDLLDNNFSTVLLLYNHFQKRLDKKDSQNDIDHIKIEINKCKDLFQKQILFSILKFNQSILKTNFNTIQKSAVSFLLDPKYFVSGAYINNNNFLILLSFSKLYQALQINYGNVFRGHLQVIKNIPFIKQEVSKNLFQSVFNEATEQSQLNKNIPELGCGAFLILKEGKNQFVKQACQSYFQTLDQIIHNQKGVIDFLQKEQNYFINLIKIDDKGLITSVQKNQLLQNDNNKRLEIVQLDPIEQNFSERSIREFLRGLQIQDQKTPQNSTAFIIGGPTGKLAHSYLKNAQEKIVGIVDSSGVVYDPEGLEKNELNHLSDQKLNISEYKGQLSSEGFKYTVTDENITLKNGKFFTTGLQLRNSFYKLDIKADILLVLGGQKNSINLEKSQFLVNENQTKFRHIIEASDQYFSLNAIENFKKNNVNIFQNSSTQLGPIISSSLEYLFYKSLSEKEYSEITNKKKGKYSKQYQSFIDDIEEKISQISQQEFQLQWNQLKSKQDISVQITQKIEKLQMMILESQLFNNETIKKKVLSQYLPNSLKQLVSYDEIIQRLPIVYQKQIFSSQIASQFYLNSAQEDNVYEFYKFMNEYENQ